MRVDLPAEVTGADIAKAVKKAAECTGFSCELNTENKFISGSVKEVPLGHKPKLEKRTGRFWAKTELLIGKSQVGERLQMLIDDTMYDYIEIDCKIPSSDPMLVQDYVSKTNDDHFSRAEPYLKEFLVAFFEELQKVEGVPV